MDKLYEVQVVNDEDMSERLYCVIAHYDSCKTIVSCYTSKEKATDSVKDEIENDLRNA